MAEASTVAMVGTLALAGALSGLAHVGIYEATKDRIEKNRADALDAAIYRVLPGAKNSPLPLSTPSCSSFSSPSSSSSHS